MRSEFSHSDILSWTPPRRTLGGPDAVKKLRVMGDTAYVTVVSPEIAQVSLPSKLYKFSSVVPILSNIRSDAISKFDGMELKKSTLTCKLAAVEPKKGRDLPVSFKISFLFLGDIYFSILSFRRQETARIKTAKESVTPLADMPYDDQIKMKNRVRSGFSHHSGRE